MVNVHLVHSPLSLSSLSLGSFHFNLNSAVQLVADRDIQEIFPEQFLYLAKIYIINFIEIIYFFDEIKGHFFKNYLKFLG